MELDFAKSVLRVGIGLLILWTAVAVGFIVAGYLGYGTRLGEFGDAFGSLNSLFSALTLVGVIATLFMQLYELKEARLDRKLEIETQKEMSSQAFFSAVATATSTWGKLMQRRFLTTDEICNPERLALAINEYGKAQLLERLLKAHVKSVSNGGSLDLKEATSDDDAVTKNTDAATKLLKIAKDIQRTAKEVEMYRAYTKQDIEVIRLKAQSIIDESLAKVKEERANVHHRMPVWIGAQLHLMAFYPNEIHDLENAGMVIEQQKGLAFSLHSVADKLFIESAGCVGIVITPIR